MPKDSPETARERPPALLYWNFKQKTLPTGVFGSTATKMIWQRRRQRRISRNLVDLTLLESPNAVSMPEAKLRQGPDWPEGCRTGPETISRPIANQAFNRQLRLGPC
jgi:hypothetical protein